jgi:NAD(P)-dependent dehydrogenase (short-subunit alcohol dehydrogenase family)
MSPGARETCRALRQRRVVIDCADRIEEDTVSGRFTDKVAIVTGGGSGIGAALCRGLAREGAVVVVADIDLARAGEVASALTGERGRAEAVKVDVTRPDEVKALVDAAVAKHGRLDYMVNNAGVTVTAEVRDLTLEHWHRVVDVNLWGVIHGVHAAYAVMVRQGSGHIVNIASGMGLAPGPLNAPYATSKHGVVGLSESLRLEAADLGVDVTVVCPGFVQTPLLDKHETVNVRREDAMAMLSVRHITADEAARKILDGVAARRAVLKFPFYVHILVWLYRRAPRVFGALMKRSLRTLRAGRRDGKG